MRGVGRYGEPRNEHWESDYARSSCAAPDCNEPLAMFFRHHCRRCGKLFCPKCVGGGLQRRLNQNAELNSRGVLSQGRVLTPPLFGRSIWSPTHSQSCFAPAVPLNLLLSPVCYECYVEENGWFSERGSAAWSEATSSAVNDRTGLPL